MRCPYCVSEIAAEALACPHCTRDLYLFKPLLERIEKLEAKLGAQSAAGTRVAELEKQLAALGGGRAPAESAADRYWTSLALATVPALLLLVAAHYSLLFLLDARPLYLRLLTLLIPVPFGFALFVWHPHRLRASAIAGFVLALLAVAAMLVTTALIDKVAVLPENARDWRESGEYALGMGLAFFTGLLLGKWRYRRLQVSPRPSRLAIFCAELFATGKDGELGMVRVANRIQKIVTALTPIATGAASVYAGIKSLIGDGG